MSLVILTRYKFDLTYMSSLDIMLSNMKKNVKAGRVSWTEAEGWF